ncbi:MAG: DNA-directed RNA polymerase subunit omega [Armatimonadetes bacterium]|nr:DNA-directed RNA polymerase subunit omega [Armatimonadota bacterium]
MKKNELIFPAPDTLNEVEYGKYILTNLAAKRAKQIKEGAPPLVRIESNHPLSIALEEIAQGKIKPILGADAAQAELDDDFSNLDDLGLDDVGLLLPSSEDGESSDDDDLDLDLGDLGDDFGDDDDDDDDEDGETKSSLSSLLEDDDDEESDDSSDDDDDTSTADSDDESEMSLDDLAAQEEEDADENEEEDN